MYNDNTNIFSEQSKASEQNVSERLRIAVLAMRQSQHEERVHMLRTQQEQSQLQQEGLQRAQHAVRLILQHDQEREMDRMRQQIQEANNMELIRFQERCANELEALEREIRPIRRRVTSEENREAGILSSSLRDLINNCSLRIAEMAEESEDNQSDSSHEWEMDADIPPLTVVHEEESYDSDATVAYLDSDEIEDSIPMESTFDREQHSTVVITELSQENKESTSQTLHFSRACGVCFSPSPLQRAVFSSCGHALCLVCAEKLRADPIDAERGLECPFCRTQGGFVKLFEDLMEEEPESNEKSPRHH